MKAIVRDTYGSPDVLRLEEVEKPVPAEGEVLVKIHATSINQADWHLLTADIFLVRLMSGGLRTPRQRILGADVAGVVEAVGPNVTQDRPGDAVFGDASGGGAGGMGGLAEYVAVPASALVPLPANLSFDEAAALPMAAVTALQGLRDVGQIRPGQKALIQGASGGVGTFAVQIAKALGTEVTAVCSTRNMDQARALGADHVIDYTKEDFTVGSERYDLIFAANGYHTLSEYKRALAPGGRYVMAGGASKQMFEALLLGRLVFGGGNRKMGVVSAKPSRQDLEIIRKLVETGKVIPCIDRRYPLEQAAEALRYLGAGHARGKVVITMDHQGD
jgi:NADPH:quinone reductase-like Zn-dependent oxidoreductase